VKRRPKSGDRDPQQLTIDWSPQTDSAAVETAEVQTHIPREPCTVPPATDPSLVQYLPWDFVATFPPPMQEAIDAGILSDEDAEPEHVRAMHEEHAREALFVLQDLDTLRDAKRRGVDPRNNKPPMLTEAKERLSGFFESEPARLGRWWQTLMDTYQEAFGPEAADAFSKALRARHAGIPVVADGSSPPAVTIEDDRNASSAASAEIQVSEQTGAETIEPEIPGRKARRVIARLPVPRPLPHAVAAGHFGSDEHGPVRPGPQEIREITENHAERLTSLLADQLAAQRSSAEAESTRLSGEIRKATEKYAEDFGEHASEQLLAYARRQMRGNKLQTDRSGRGG
jgi:hypothetical protein